MFRYCSAEYVVFGSVPEFHGLTKRKKGILFVRVSHIWPSCSIAEQTFAGVASVTNVYDPLNDNRRIRHWRQNDHDDNDNDDDVHAHDGRT